MTEAQSKRWGEIIEMDDWEFVDEDWMLDAMPPPRFCGSMTLRTYREYERSEARSRLAAILARRPLAEYLTVIIPPRLPAPRAQQRTIRLLPLALLFLLCCGSAPEPDDHQHAEPGAVHRVFKESWAEIDDLTTIQHGSGDHLAPPIDAPARSDDDVGVAE
ncbi:hypothetical protein LCGC14_1700340 [marine sediment metagenome]|uniref:Uncharacterized protein n=1 Tax=marine sediment metagenome TaxID=412755 RepID=A0A0F9HHY1_9ZZZZ